MLNTYLWQKQLGQSKLPQHMEKLLKNSKKDKNHNPLIHPVIIFPYSNTKENHIRELYSQLEANGVVEGNVYAKPITVVNNQTVFRNTRWGNEADKDWKKSHDEFLELREFIQKRSTIKDAWCVDTCQTWLAGFGTAYNPEGIGDVYWLIPGDFEYADLNSTTDVDKGRIFWEQLFKMPTLVAKGDYDLVLGEIKVPLNSSKQLIDTYGTYGLLYNWFPSEAQGIRKITDKPRTEFFAISHNYLEAVLRRRWYAYEQTIVILLHGMRGKEAIRKIHKVDLGAITDHAQGRDSLSSAMQQVERTERVLKLYWREYHEQLEDPSWRENFRQLDHQSQQIRTAALVILEQILRK